MKKVVVPSALRGLHLHGLMAEIGDEMMVEINCAFKKDNPQVSMDTLIFRSCPEGCFCQHSAAFLLEKQRVAELDEVVNMSAAKCVHNGANINLSDTAFFERPFELVEAMVCGEICGFACQ